MWLTEHWTHDESTSFSNGKLIKRVEPSKKDSTKQAMEDMKMAKMYSTIYKDLDCREVLKSKL